MEEIARVYAEALFEVAKEKGKLDAIHEQLGAVRRRARRDRELQVFFFSPYFSSAEKQRGDREGGLRRRARSSSTSSSCWSRSTGCR